jgi:hypothetical protein
MARDSLYGETIVWSGKPRGIVRPAPLRVVAAVALVVAVVELCFAITLATALDVRTGGLLILSGWCATLALLAWRLPVVFTQKLEYFITDKHVIWRWGRLRRTIERDAISYALIRWRADGTVGDLELVRAVPTGALRRTLHVTLSAVPAPDRVWALIRGIDASAPLGTGARPLAQRLDPDERVLWSGVPRKSPWTVRRTAGVLGAMVLGGAAVHSAIRAFPPLARLLALHMLTLVQALLLVGGVGLALALLVVVAVGTGWAAGFRPRSLARETRYFVTNRRVLIRRGREELHLDRSRIAYVIAAPSTQLLRVRMRRRPDLQDVYLVLDGPHARALAASGAFGGEGDGTLQPVLAAIDDAETVGTLLKTRTSVPPVQQAA